MTIIYLGSALFVILFVAAMAQFVISAAERRQIVAGALQGTVKQEPPGSRFDRLSHRFNATRFGRYLERDLALAGITFPPILVFACLVAATIAIPYLLAQLLAPLFALVGLVCGYALLRAWLHRARERRKERFVQQIPELARLLSNATNAGLSIATAWAVAEAELAEHGQNRDPATERCGAVRRLAGGRDVAVERSPSGSGGQGVDVDAGGQRPLRRLACQGLAGYLTDPRRPQGGTPRDSDDPGSGAVDQHPGHRHGHRNAVDVERHSARHG